MNIEYSLTDEDRETLKTFLEKKSLYYLVFDHDGKPRLEQTAGCAPIHLRDGCPWALGWVYFNSLGHEIPETERLEKLFRYATTLVTGAAYE